MGLRIFCAKLSIRPLSAYGITGAHVADLVDKAARASSMKANPIVLTSAELTRLLQQAL